MSHDDRDELTTILAANLDQVYKSRENSDAEPPLNESSDNCVAAFDRLD